jgi:hypothetical protein
MLRWYPPVSVFIAVLALFGVLVPLLREHMGPSEKACWTFMMLMLVGLELRSIYLDRAAHDRKEAEDRNVQLRNFGEIAKGIDTTISNSQKQFEATMNSANKLLDLSQRNLGSVTGGDSYIYFRFLATEHDANSMVVWIIHDGEYPLREIQARITDLDLFREVVGRKPLDLKELRATDVATFIVSSSFPHTSKQMIVPCKNFAASDHHDFNVFFLGPNGGWTELIRQRRVNGTWYCAIRIVQQKSGEEPHLTDRIDPEYPDKDIDWNH